MKATVKRELRVAFSKKAQPVWFRIAKWVSLIGAIIALWGKPALGWFVSGLTIAGLIVHLTWRWKTKGWTQPWLGWNDVKAGKDS